MDNTQYDKHVIMKKKKKKKKLNVIFIHSLQLNRRNEKVNYLYEIIMKNRKPLKVDVHYDILFGSNIPL